MPALQPCPGCGCEIDSGLLWFAGPGLARICCNKRCASRAQKRHEALATGKARGRKSMPLLPIADDPVEAERGWSSLNQDVMAQVAARLGLRDCLAAALTCKHWRTHITRGPSNHVALRIDDMTPEGSRRVPDGRCACCGGAHDVIKCKCKRVAVGTGDTASPAKAADKPAAAGGADAAAQLLDSARRLLPHVDHLSVSVYSRCRQRDYLLKHMRALSRWSGLTSLDISWVLAPDPTSLLRAVQAGSGSDSGSDAGCSDPETDGGGARRRSAVRRARHAPKPPPPPGPLPRCLVGDTQRLCAASLASLGLLPNLTRLSITAKYSHRHMGLAGLAGLSRLTELELRQAPPDGVEVADWAVLSEQERLHQRRFGSHSSFYREPWSANEADMGALSALRVLRVHGDLLSPPALGAVGPHLTRLELHRLSLARYTGLGQGETMTWTIEDMAPQLLKCKRLRYFSLSLAWDPLDMEPYYALNTSGWLEMIVRELRHLSRDQVLARANHESRMLELQQQHGGSGQPSQAAGGAGGGRRRGRGRRLPGQQQAAGVGEEREEDVPPVEPLEVVLDLATHFRPLCVANMSVSVLAAVQRHHQRQAQLLQAQQQWQQHQQHQPPERQQRQEEQEEGEERAQGRQEVQQPDGGQLLAATDSASSDITNTSSEDAALAAGAPAATAVPAGAAATAHQPATAGQGASCDPDLPPSYILSSMLLEDLVGLAGLSHLSINFHAGGSQQLHTLSQLTRLSHLALRCGPAVRIELDSWDAHRLCTSLGPRLTHLDLELPASCLGADVLESVRLLRALRCLRLSAGSQVRQVPLTRRELRRALARAAPSWHGEAAPAAGGGGGDSGGVEGGAVVAGAAVEVAKGTAAAAAAASVAAAAAGVKRPSPELVAEVKGAQTPLLFLQQLFSAMDGSEAVREVLLAEAEWRAQQAAAAVEAAAVEAAAELEAAVANAVAEVAPAATGDGVDGAAAQEAPAQPAAVAAAAGAAPDADPPQQQDQHPVVELAAAMQQQQADEGVPAGAVAAPPGQAAAAGEAGADGGGGGGPAAAAGGGGLHGAAAGGAALEMPTLPEWVMRWSRGEPRIPPAEQGAAGRGADGGAAAQPPTPLHCLTSQDLDRLRKAMTREELVPAPAFRLGDWAPKGLQRLWLRGFSGLQAPSVLPGGGGGGRAAVGGGSEGRVAKACVVLPALEAVDVVVMGSGEAAATAREALAAWCDAGGAPLLKSVFVEGMSALP